MSWTSRVAVASSKTSTRCSGSRACRRSTARSRRSASSEGAGTSTRTVFRSGQRGKASWKIALPQSSRTTRSAARVNISARVACARASRVSGSSARPGAGSGVRVVLASAGTTDHDLVLLDRDLDGTVARPVLGVDGVVLHGGVEPQPVALLAVVERALERAPGGAAAAGAAAGAATAARLRLLLAVLFRLLGGALGGLLGCLRVLLGLARGLGLELGRDRGVVLGAQIGLLAVGGLVAIGLEILLALERLDLLDCRFELVRDPCVGAALSHPRADLVKLGTQGPAAHAAGRLATQRSGA